MCLLHRSSKFRQLRTLALDDVKHQYGQICIESLRLLAELKRDVDDASDEDYLQWQAQEIERLQCKTKQIHHPEISLTDAVCYIRSATMEHACSNSLASSQTMPLYIAVGALLHYALSKASISVHNESTERDHLRIVKQTKDVAKAYITSIINITYVQFIKEALAHIKNCTDEVMQWINATHGKLELSIATAEAKLLT